MRTLFHDRAAERISVMDERFYTNDMETFYPSVTTILECFPKGEWFYKWAKEQGEDADKIRDVAGEFGTNVHNATEEIDNGAQLYWADPVTGKPLFSLEEWVCILNYTDFLAKLQPQILANERQMCSESLGFGGTIDRVVKMWGKRWLIDLKTSNQISDTYILQLAAYAMMWNEAHPDLAIDHVGVLWLKAQIKTDKLDEKKQIAQGKPYQGKRGWQLVTFDEPYQDAFKDFQHVQAIFKRTHPNFKPLNLIYPDVINKKSA